MSDATFIRVSDVLSSALQTGSAPLSDDGILAECRCHQSAMVASHLKNTCNSDFAAARG
jgi:hypothetical protein